MIILAGFTEILGGPTQDGFDPSRRDVAIGLADDQRSDSRCMWCRHAGSCGPSEGVSSDGAENQVKHPRGPHDPGHTAKRLTGINEVSTGRGQGDEGLSVIAVARREIEITREILGPAVGRRCRDAQDVWGHGRDIDAIRIVIGIDGIIARRSDQESPVIVGVGGRATEGDEEFGNLLRGGDLDSVFIDAVAGEIGSEAHIDDLGLDVARIDQCGDQVIEIPAAGELREHFQRDNLRLGRDSNNAKSVVGGGNGAGDMGSMVEEDAGANSPIFTGHKRFRERGVQVGSEIGMRVVNPGVHYRYANACAAIPGIPSGRSLDGGVTPLEVKESIVIETGGRIPDVLDNQAVARGTLRQPLKRDVGRGGTDALDGGRVQGEVRIVRTRDGDTDLRNGSCDGSAGCGDLFLEARRKSGAGTQDNIGLGSGDCGRRCDERCRNEGGTP